MKKIKLKNARLSRKRFLVTKRKSGKADTLMKVLDTNPENEAFNNSEELVKIPRKKPGRKFYFAFGIFVLILSVIGLISTVKFGMEKVSDIVNNTALKEELEDVIYPLVICDPAVFDNTGSIGESTVIMSSCWKIILDGDTERYKKEFDYIIVPAADIESAATLLYGENITVNHKQIVSSDIAFYYDSDTECYRIPYNPKYFSYSPKIENISKTDDGYILEVGYISPTPAWLSSKGEEILPEKYMIYTLKKSSSGYIISSVALSERKTDTEL